MKKDETLFRGEEVEILVNHHGRVNPKFFQKAGIITGVNKKNRLPYTVMVIGVGADDFKETELRRINPLKS